MQTRQASIIRAILWMGLALLLFSLLAIGVKELTPLLSTAQILFLRNAVALIIITIVIIKLNSKHFRSDYLKKHFFRNLAHFGGQYGWVYGIAFLPLAEVFALEFTTPIWAALLAVFVLKEQLTWSRLIAVALGFIGVVVILRPGIEIVHPAAIAVLLGAAAYGMTHVFTKSLSQTDSSLTIIFYMALIQMPLALLFSLTEMTSFDINILADATIWLWIVVIGVAGLLAHYAMSQAFNYADAMVVVPIDYLRLPLIMVVGAVVYNESVELFVVLGSMLMLSGNLISLRNEKHN